MKLAFSLVVAASVFATGVAQAHGIWTEKRYGHLEVVYGHGAEDEAYAPEKIKGVWAYDANGSAVPVTVERRVDHVRLSPVAAPAILTVVLDNGVWSKNRDGKSVNLPMAEVPGAISSSRSFKYSLAILEPHAQIPDDVKLAMVIRPLKDPLEVGVGEPLPVEVRIDGKPAAGIALHDDYRGMPEVSGVKTDANGRASVVVRNAGLNVIAAQARMAANDGTRSERSLFTTLSFIGEGHHH